MSTLQDRIARLEQRRLFTQQSRIPRVAISFIDGGPGEPIPDSHFTDEVVFTIDFSDSGGAEAVEVSL